MGLEFGKYRFICRFEKNAILPDFKGSTFHGVFGRALKNVVCALKGQACEECLLKSKCLYVNIFESNLVRKPLEQYKYTAIPHPYLIDPPADRESAFEKDHTIHCDLTLFGEFNQNLPYFIYAFDVMGKIGLGRRISGSRGKYRLVEVLNRNRTIYSAGDETIQMMDNTHNFIFNGSEKSTVEKLEVRLETPLRVKHNERLVRDLPFHVLSRAMIRRMTGLMNAYGDGEPDWDYSGLVRKAESVKTHLSKLRWHDVVRYSFRQKRRTPLGGMVGSVFYDHVPSEFLPLLEFSQHVNIGKNTTFGLGKISFRQ